MTKYCLKIHLSSVFKKLKELKKMTNRSTCRRHGAHDINQRRKKSTFVHRDNKAKARARRAVLREKGLNC